MNTKMSPLIILVLLVCINIFLLFYVIRVKKESATNKYYLQSFTENNNKLKNSFNTLKDLSKLQFRSEYINAPISISNAVITKKTLIIRIHSNDCNECVNNGIKILEKYNVKQKMPIIVCADYPNEQALKSDFPTLAYSFVIQPKIETDFDKISDPYMFVYDPAKKTASHYVYVNWQLMDVFDRYASLL